MKLITCSSLIALLLSSAAMAQVTVYSDVGGFDTIAIDGSSGGGSRLTFAAAQFLQPTKYSGYATQSEPASLFDASASWAEGAFNGGNGSHYVEILSLGGHATGPGVGLTRTILETLATEKKLRLNEPLPVGMGVSIEYRVVSHWTLATVFGATNTAGLQGGTSLTADQVQIWNGSSYDSYYYQTTGIGGVGWRMVGNQTANAAGAIIRPDQSVLIKRVGGSAVPLVVNGWVKTGQASLEVVQGFNFFPNPFSEPLTLGTCGLFTGNPNSGLAAGELTTADQVMLWNGLVYETYYYQNAGLGGVGWRRVGAQSIDASGTIIKSGTGFILRRNRVGGFTWQIPQPPTGL
jgi:uncharacterized protein (TIGR02597 family)